MRSFLYLIHFGASLIHIFLFCQSETSTQFQLKCFIHVRSLRYILVVKKSTKKILLFLECRTRTLKKTIFDNRPISTFPFFRALYKSIQNSQTSQDYIFQSLQYLSTKLHNFTKLRMLFQAVLKIPISNVFLEGIGLFKCCCRFTRLYLRNSHTHTLMSAYQTPCTLVFFLNEICVIRKLSRTLA